MDTEPYELFGATLSTKSEIKQHVKSIVLRAHDTVVVNVEEQADMDKICAFVEILHRVGFARGVVPTLFLNFQDDSADKRETDTTLVSDSIRSLNQGKLNCLLKIDFLVE